MSAALVTLMAGMALLQNYLLYFPEPAPLAALEQGGLRTWPDRNAFRGLLTEPATEVRGTVVILHGNAGHAGQRGYYAQVLTGLGFRVILAEYPAYGPRPGALGERTLVNDAADTLRLAYQAFGAPLILLGESLGAAVAAGAAAQTPDCVAGLVLITPWDRLESVAGHHYAWLPVSWLMSDPYDSVRYLSSFQKPVVVVLAERDSVVPVASGLRLYAALPGPKRLVVVQGADHNDWPARVDGAWWAKVLESIDGDGP
jgi:hypothetical protein